VPAPTRQRMRRWMLERVESVLSQNYLVAFAVMWPVGLLSIFVTLALLRSKGPFWHLFLISAVCWTLVCSVDTILFHLFKRTNIACFVEGSAGTTNLVEQASLALHVSLSISPVRDTARQLGVSRVQGKLSAFKPAGPQTVSCR
jgi:hypothetical protein